jgi:hypothetical protein
MSLLITFYKTLVRPENEAVLLDENGDLLDEDTWTQAINDPEYIGHGDGLPQKLICKKVDPVNLSYNGVYYRHFRRQLSDIALLNHDDTLFRELIHFTDCEGFIGPQTCSKLAGDFEICRAQLIQTAINPQVYDSLWQAFARVAGTGIAIFR